jgi:prepilin-type N-terminal cleavage/methylation domain-containing protein
MFNSKEKGFSLVELIVVLIITAILAQLGFTAFNRYVRRTRAFAAKTALKNIQRECESNRDLEAPETFTLLPIRGYSIATRDTNSCLGQSSDGKVAAIADNQEEIPNYFYDFLLGQISCSFSNSSSGMFKSCTEESLKISNWDEYASETSKTQNIIPSSSKSSCENSWAGTSYTGSASFAIDSNPNTKWTCNGPANIEFELSESQEIRSINVGFTGSVTNGNYVKIYVDDGLVAEGTQNAFDKTWLIQPTRGNKIRYETTTDPHLVSGDGTTQTTSWSEIGELSINGKVGSCTNKNNCWNNVNDK